MVVDLKPSHRFANTYVFLSYCLYYQLLKFRRVAFVRYSFWHNKTPHLLSSIPYCLTNGVQFKYVQKLDFINYSDAAAAGYKFGEGIEDKIKNLFDFNGNDPLGAGDDPFSDLSDLLDGIYGSAAETAANTAAAADALDFAQEDLTYLRDIAQREAINRFTTAQIKIEQHNENHISSDTDLDGIMDAWASDFAQRLDISTEGVHA